MKRLDSTYERLEVDKPYSIHKSRCCLDGTYERLEVFNIKDGYVMFFSLDGTYERLEANWVKVSKNVFEFGWYI